MNRICLVNLAELDPPTNGGTSRIAYEVSKMLAAWSRTSPDFTTFFVVNWRFAARFGEWLGEDVFTVPYFSTLDVRRIANIAQPDVIVSPLFGMAPFVGRRFAGVRHIVEVPDALMFDKPAFFTPRQFRRRAAIYAQLSNASTVVTLSAYARDRLQHHLNIPAERFRVIPLGADALDSVPPSDDPQPLPKRYVFYPANVWPHKRHALLFEAMARISAQQPDVHLVLSGGRDPHSAARIRELMQQYPGCRVVDFGYVTDRQLRTLYENAEALLFLSQYEGFGMPLVEAMRYGCPVICAPVTAIPEIVGEAALYVDSDDPQDWANAFLTQLPQQRRAIVEKGRQRAQRFTWQRTREQWRTALEETGIGASESVDTSPETADPLIDPDWFGRLMTLSDGIQRGQSRAREMLYLSRHYVTVRAIRSAFHTALSDYLTKPK